jgi:putative effector of murein hydrolase
LEAPLTTAFLLFATLHGFVFGARLPKTFTKFVHPLVTCTSITWLSAKLLGLVNGCSFAAMLGRYKTGKLPPAGTGAGDLLLFLLGPAVMSLACQMYDRRKLMKENLAEVATAVGVSSFGGLFGTAAAVRLLEIGSPSVRLSLLSRNITSPLAMAIAKILGADVSLAVSMVVMTGLVGANFGASSLDAFGIKDAVARGLGIGAAAHGLGTAAFSNEEDAFPFAAIAMALTASSCTVLVSIPVIKKMVLQLALGW